MENFINMRFKILSEKRMHKKHRKQVQLLLVISTSFLFSCSTNNFSKYNESKIDRSMASKYAEISSEFEGKDFFEEADGFSVASFLGQHDVATFFSWSLKNPIPLFERLRREKPIYSINPIMGSKKHIDDGVKTDTVILSLNEDVREVLSNNKVFTTRFYRHKMDQSVGKFMLAHDDDKVNKEKPWMRSMLKMEDLPKIREMVKKHTQKAIAESNVNGRIEVVNALARKVPLEIIQDYFGLIGPDLRTMYRWSKYSQYSFFHNVINKKHYEEKGREVGREMHEHLKKLMAEKRADQSYLNGQTVLDRLMQTNVPEGEMLDFYDGRVRTNIIGTLVGGVETTQAAIVNVLEFMLKNPQVLKKAQEAISANNMPLFEKFVWEALRFRPVNTVLIRYAESDYIIGKETSREYKIPKGAMVVVSPISAMFDEAKVSKANNFRIDRPGINSPDSPYLHFGFGNHKCLGDYVAQVMVPEILKEILSLDGIRLIDGEMGKISYDDNITPLEIKRDMADAPFPESFVVEFNSTREKNKLTIADPRFAFEDYLMDYDRVFYRKCLSNFDSLSTLKNTFAPMLKNLKGQFNDREIQDIFLCRLPEKFHFCMSEIKSDELVSKYKKCKNQLSPNEDFFFQTEILGAPLDLTKVPEPEKAGINTGYEFEEDMKFYDRATFRMAHRNPMSAGAFPVTDDRSALKALFYTRLEWNFRICIGKNALIKNMPDLRAYSKCMENKKLKLDPLTDSYYRHIFFNDSYKGERGQELDGDLLE